MTFIDIHTHNEGAHEKSAILNSPHYIEKRNISLGIHPWNIGDGWQERLSTIEEVAGNGNVVAIGECGIDRIKSPAGIEIQKEVLRAHALLAEKVQKPLIIHCVKGVNDIIAIRKEINAGQAWIIHGFRGKPQQAIQLTKAGLYISLGEHFNTETAKAIPPERLFIESDESILPIDEIYRRIAAARNIDTEELTLQITANIGIFRQF